MGGLVAVHLMFGKSRAYEHWAVNTAETLFHLSTGLILFIAAMIPGDGDSRFLEAGIGLILLVRGVCRPKIP